MVIILTGVSGSGKTTVGELIAADLKWAFYEGDSYHAAANIEKMSKGIPLTDKDREPWLAALRRLIAELLARSENAVIACSALKQRYRDYLRQGSKTVQIVYLKGDQALIRKRLEQRKGHFMDPTLLASQFAALEEAGDALVVDISDEPQTIVKVIKKELGLK